MTQEIALDQAWVPSACTLPTAEQPLRVAEFDALFADAVRAVARPDRTAPAPRWPNSCCRPWRDCSSPRLPVCGGCAVAVLLRQGAVGTAAGAEQRALIAGATRLIAGRRGRGDRVTGEFGAG
ncbi:hypothetical protein AB0K05_27425 [Nonomuraea sp. NPDC049486]|uniref:hypothetical protein n=1 Tax=Nonomuraea sp. NPDC049486 TaxID=3155773 RepID=UPI003449E49D